jgi:glyoxylase-like metal-dependent hydrolase (beta-lactamase superfamily II)
VEGARLTVLHTPGHTSDHVVLHLEEENAVFSGDCILGEGTAVFERLHEYLVSLQRILALAPGRVYPGHGPLLEEPGPRIEFYIRHRQEREEQVVAALTSSGPLTARQLVETVYTETPAHLHPAAEVNVLQHLEKLLVEGRVERGEGGRWRMAS